MAAPILRFMGNQEDVPYLPRLKALVGGATVFVTVNPILTWAEVSLYCKKNNITGIISTNRKLLELLSGDPKATLNDYAGSYFKRDDIEVVFLDPLPQLVSVPYGAFITRRYISKLATPDTWHKYEPFSWRIATPANIEESYAEFSSADLLAVDIETTKVNLAITSIAYTAVFLTGDTPTFKSIVFEIDSDWAIAWMRKFNKLPAIKILQNGKYDCSYLLRYNAGLTNWLADTATAFHCWYSELPKDLGYLQAFFLREGRYWKDMADGDAYMKLEYNARDTYATAVAWCEWLLASPAWAKTNYQQEFPLVYPCLLAEMTGIKRDMSKLEEAYNEVDAKIKVLSASLDKMLGVVGFNVNSRKQMDQLMRALGCADIAKESCDEKHLMKASFRHPLIARILDVVLEIRGLRKLNSTYLTPGKELNGVILWALNPHGTDTGRLASKEHHFWCGLQGQNIPRGFEVKQTLVAFDGFCLAESDLEQAESRDTAYIAGCEPLIAAVSGTRDFHSVNASAFFGVPYETIYQDAIDEYIDAATGEVVPYQKGHTLNKILRDLAKRVNHGANYNMGANVLVETMGLTAIYKAAAALNLPKHWLPRDIATFLLDRFHKTYPELAKVYYPGLVHQIKTTKMLVSKATHDSEFNVAGWTRYCFNDPEKDKRALNSYIAHEPQSLNAMTLNKAFMKVFYTVALPNPTTFRLCCQIHDSILFQFKKGYEHLALEVKKCMEIPVTVTGYDGKTRTFTVPAALKAGKDGKGAYRWSETE